MLRDGAYVGTKDIGEVDESRLVSMMVGRSVDRLYPKKMGTNGDIALELRGVSYRSVVREVSLSLRRGEIVGLAGLVGSGRTDLALTLFGVTPATAGEILIDGKPVRIGGPDSARDFGIALIPEDRGQQGLIRSYTVAENVALVLLKRLVRGFIIDMARVAEETRSAIRRFGIRTRGSEQIVRRAVGRQSAEGRAGQVAGDQPAHPGHGRADPRHRCAAKAEIHLLMRKLAAEGMAILMISSELPEVLGMSDRVLVMSSGRIVAEFGKDEATPEAVGAAMTHAVGRRQAA